MNGWGEYSDPVILGGVCLGSWADCEDPAEGGRRSQHSALYVEPARPVVAPEPPKVPAGPPAFQIGQSVRWSAVSFGGPLSVVSVEADGSEWAYTCHDGEGWQTDFRESNLAPAPIVGPVGTDKEESHE